MQFFLLPSFLLFSLSLASPLVRRFNQQEHVILANCYDASSIKYSEMAYFSSQPTVGTSTTITAIVNTPFDTFVTWEGSTISATFASGDTFESNVVSVPNGVFAGTGSNAYTKFNCFHNEVGRLYTDSPNTPIPLTCSQVYDCSHLPSAPPCFGFECPP